MAHVSGVQILQGKDERGKDIVFYRPGGFGEPMLCACVVKNVKITGNVGSSTGARTILLQAEQAFDSSHTDGSGKETKVERVYIVTPFDLSPTTIASIEGKLKERSGQISFIGGALLFDLFKKHWPDYFADEASLLDRHLEQTKGLYEFDSPLPSLAFQYSLSLDTVPTKLMKVYVAQGFHRDISAYREGPTLVSSLPHPEALENKISKNEIAELQETFKRFDLALEYLAQWGLAPSQFSSLDLSASLTEFIEKLRSEHKKTVEFSRAYQTVTPGTRIMLLNPRPLIPLLRNLISERLALLRDLRVHLSNLDNFLSAEQVTGIQYLQDEAFLKAGLIGDCARAAKDRILLAGSEARKFVFPKDILVRWRKSLLIVAAPGFGKTSFCKWNALQDAERFNLEQSHTMPVYVPLHKLSRKPLGTFEDIFLSTLGRSALIAKQKKPQANEINKDMARQPKIRLYLDGLDEVASVKRQEEITTLAKEGIERDSALQVIITSRDYVFGPWLEWLPKVHLSEFSESELDEFIDRWIGNDKLIHQKFCAQLRGLPALRALMRIPLLATLTIMVFRQTDRLPETKTRLYEIFTDLLSGGWDMAKGVLRESRFGQRVKLIVVSSLAGRVHKLRRRDFGNDEFRETLRSVFPGPLNKEWRALRDEILADGLISKSGTVMQFSHMSFQEFLAAKDFLGTPNHLRVLRALELYLYGNDWWKEVLKFYVGLSSSPQEIASWLSSQIRHFKDVGAMAVSRLNAFEIVGAVVESFPHFPPEELARIMETALDFNTILTFLKERQENVLNA